MTNLIKKITKGVYVKAENSCCGANDENKENNNSCCGSTLSDEGCCGSDSNDKGCCGLDKSSNSCCS